MKHKNKNCSKPNTHARVQGVIWEKLKTSKFYSVHNFIYLTIYDLIQYMKHKNKNSIHATIHVLASITSKTYVNKVQLNHFIYKLGSYIRHIHIQ